MTTTTAKQLLRSLLREAKKMNDYNFRSYALRRIKVGFRYNASLQDSNEIQQAIAKGQEDLNVLKRQVIIGNLYPNPISVMEQKK